MCKLPVKLCHNTDTVILTIVIIIVNYVVYIHVDLLALMFLHVLKSMFEFLTRCCDNNGCCSPSLC